MTPLTIVANIHVHPDPIKRVKAEPEKLVSTTRAEKGRLQCDLRRDNSNPAHFMFFENGASRKLWQTHMGAPHLAAYMNATEGAVAHVTLNLKTAVDRLLSLKESHGS